MSVVLFGRLIFDKKINHYNLRPTERKKQIKECLLKAIDFDTEIKKTLLEAGKKRHVRDDFNWHFAGIREKDNHIYGKLAKGIKSQKAFLDEETKDLVFENVEEQNYIVFLIDLKKHIIAYELKSGVGEKAPTEVIQDVFNILNKNKETLKINTIMDKRKIIERMRSLSELKKITLSVYPTNPDSTTGSDKMDNFLRNGCIKRMVINVYGDERGIKLDKGGLLESGFHLVEEGYGKAKVEGVRNEEKQTLSMGEIPAKKTIHTSKNDDVNIQKIKHHIEELAKELDDK